VTPPPRMRSSRILVHLTREDMGHEGRYLFLLLYFLTRHGEQITLVSPPRELGTYGGLSHTLRTVSFRHEMPLPSPDMILITDSEADAATALGWEKVFWLDYEIFKDRASLKGIPYAVVPYSMHPLVYGTLDGLALNTLHNLKRYIRLFFSGNTDKRNYSGSLATNRFQMLSRCAALEFAKNHLANSLLTTALPQDLRHGDGAEHEHKFVVIEGEAGRIKRKNWLATLAHCDFFLSLPGVKMPLSHNAIEAIAAAAIPLINYPKWFRPPLENGVNCLAFTDEPSLAKALNEAFSMGECQIAAMRQNVIEYYTHYLAPDQFAARLWTQPSGLKLFYNVEAGPVLEHLHPGSVYLSDPIDPL